MIGSAIALAVGTLLAPAAATKTRNWLDDISEVVLEEQPVSTSSVMPVFLNVKPQTLAQPFSVGASHGDQMNDVADELDSYALLENDWDGEGSIAPDLEILLRAKQLLEFVPGGLPFPKPMLSSSGEVGLYWRKGDVFADVVFDDDGSFSLFIKDSARAGSKAFIEGVVVNSHARSVLAQYLVPLSRQQA